MSTAVNQHWNRHYRALKETTTMPLTAGLPEAATPDPLDPEVLALVQAANEQWLSRQAARDARVAEVQRALAEEQVEEQEAPSFARLSAHGVSCEVAIVLVTLTATSTIRLYSTAIQTKRLIKRQTRTIALVSRRRAKGDAATTNME
jgi:hypothetical protein